MIDLHTHTVFSDGVLIPAELIQRYKVCGCHYLAITDHVDATNIDLIIPRIASIAPEYSKYFGVTVLPGCELTHIPPKTFHEMVGRAREWGAKVIVGHGETAVEPVAKGTNRAAIEAGVTILAHPGFITEDDARLAAEKGVFLEVSARNGHSLTNGHVAAVARKTGARLIFSSDGHTPDNIATRAWADSVLRGAGLSDDEIKVVWEHAYDLCKGMST